MSRPKGSKNKKAVKAKPVTKKTTKPTVKKSAPKVKLAAVEVSSASVEVPAVKPVTIAKRTSDGGVVIAAQKDASDTKKTFDVVMQGGKAVKVESTDDPVLD